MKTRTTAFLSILALIALPLILGAQRGRNGRPASTSVDVDQQVTSCGDIQVTYNRQPAVTDETETTLPASQVSSLRAQMTNGGIYLSGWDRNEYSVRTCKAVPADDPNASGTLREITTSIRSGLLSVSGPVSETWTATQLDM